MHHIIENKLIFSIYKEHESHLLQPPGQGVALLLCAGEAEQQAGRQRRHSPVRVHAAQAPLQRGNIR